MKNSSNLFKDKASAIIQSSPQSMKALLEDDSQNISQKQNGQIHKDQSVEMSIREKKDDGKPVKVTRFHVHIRQDLADKVFEAVFERKKNKSKIKKEASQRAIIEEALEMYFK